MLLQDGSIKTESAENGKALGLYRKKQKIVSLVLLITGAVGLAAYLVASSLLIAVFNGAPRWMDIFLVFAVPFTLGLIGCVTIARLKSREKKEGRTSEMQFYADCFIVKAQTAQTPSESKRISYLDGILKCENEKFGYILLIRRPVILPFSKENLGADELNAIRRLFKIQIDGECAELKNYKTEEEN